MLCEEYSVLALTETWLTQDIEDNKFYNNYNLQ